MPERENRREKILNAAAALFMERGYHETSVRSIAEVVGCTEAALYYHFKGGKRELFQEVIEAAVLDLRAPIEHMEASVSLSDLVERYGHQLGAIRGGRIQQLVRWISYEIRRLTAEERESFYRALLSFHAAVRTVAARYLGDTAQADEFAWLLICTGFGYRQIFFDMELQKRLDVDITHLYHLLAEGMSNA